MTKRAIVFLAALLLLGACESRSNAPSSPSTGTLQAVTARDLQIVTGQTVYVPAYSEIFMGTTSRTMPLTVTLAIHNTDPNAAIIIQSVQYFDTDGVLVRDYVSEPVAINPLATRGFVVEDQDRSGGWGANFIVVWGAEVPVYEPVIEAIMVSTQGTHGISLISPGRVVSQTRAGDGE